MENAFSNFDESSKLTIKELIKGDRKFGSLIKKLQTAKGKIDSRVELMKVLTQEIKK
jgi:hypothetical protein